MEEKSENSQRSRRLVKDEKGSKKYWEERRRIVSFDQILETIMDFPIKRVAVAVAQDSTVLEAVIEAREKEVAEYVLVGNKDEILRIADEMKKEVRSDAIINVTDPLAAAAEAVRQVHDGYADVLMKGYIHTDDFLRAVLDRETGLRTRAVMSHVFIWESLSFRRLIFVTDGAMNIAPTIDLKADIIINAVHLARMFGLEKPKVAILAAVEVVNPNMPATVEAAALAGMSYRGQFSVPCLIDGPFALDNAINAEAAAHKKIGGYVAGKADILVVPSIEAGNMLAKSFAFLGCGDTVGVLIGAKRPVVLTSRADSPRSKFFSIATAVLMSGFERDLRLKIGKVHY
jgi:phosphate butyryltransferase